jgi:hypothetical protein
MVLSDKKMNNTINTERFTVVFAKTYKLEVPGFGTTGVLGVDGINRAHTDADTMISRTNKIIKVFMPGKKIVRKGELRYENSNSQPKFFDYQVILYAYSNWSTSEVGTSYNVARLNDYVRQVCLKDA